MGRWWQEGARKCPHLNSLYTAFDAEDVNFCSLPLVAAALLSFPAYSISCLSFFNSCSHGGLSHFALLVYLVLLKSLPFVPFFSGLTDLKLSTDLKYPSQLVDIICNDQRTSRGQFWYTGRRLMGRIFQEPSMTEEITFFTVAKTGASFLSTGYRIPRRKKPAQARAPGARCPKRLLQTSLCVLPGCPQQWATCWPLLETAPPFLVPLFSTLDLGQLSTSCPRIGIFN